MRIYLSISNSKISIPFDHLPALVGTLHKWIGKNNEFHGSTSLYSFSWLKGAKPVKNGLSFPLGADWFISCYDVDLLKTIIRGIQSDPSIGFGLTVKEMVIREDPPFTNSQLFTLASPVLVKQNINEVVKHFTYKDLESDEIMTRTLKTKLTRAELDSSGVSVSFDRTYLNAKTKKVNYKGIGNMSNICPVVVRGTTEQIAFAWNVGIGNSTGIGFGALN
jgi:CRISPR-associated endoribonuclease Cas6